MWIWFYIVGIAIAFFIINNKAFIGWLLLQGFLYWVYLSWQKSTQITLHLPLEHHDPQWVSLHREIDPFLDLLVDRTDVEMTFKELQRLSVVRKTQESLWKETLEFFLQQLFPVYLQLRLTYPDMMERERRIHQLRQKIEDNFPL